MTDMPINLTIRLALSTMIQMRHSKGSVNKFIYETMIKAFRSTSFLSGITVEDFDLSSVMQQQMSPGVSSPFDLIKYGVDDLTLHSNFISSTRWLLSQFVENGKKYFGHLRNNFDFC
jgi:hypothetical protein